MPLANLHFCQWLGLPSEQVVGAHSRQALGEARERALWPYITAALAGQAQTFERDESHADGSIGSRLIYFFPTGATARCTASSCSAPT